jgi:hypothetical protein
MNKSETAKGVSPSETIDARIKELDDWRGRTLSRVRALIKRADPEVLWSTAAWPRQDTRPPPISNR